jgi:hypothetical protein
MNPGLAPAISVPRWNAQAVALSVPIAFIAQVLFTPCLCHLSAFVMGMAVVFDVLLLIRATIAHFLKERGRGWILYVLLSYTSPWWISWLVHEILVPSYQAG